MSNSTCIEMEDDVREDIGECLPSAPKKKKRRVEDVQSEPQVEAQEEMVTPDNFKYNIGDIIKMSDPNTNLISPVNPDKQYHDNLRVIFRFYDGNHVYIVEAEDGICLITPEQQTELVERSTAPNTPPDNKPEPEPEVKTVSQEEYFREVSTLNGKIRQLEQQYADERQKTDREKAKVEQMLHRSVGCLDAVKAMLESSGGGATHRMRDFYAEAMVKFIGNAKATLQSYAEPEPF